MARILIVTTGLTGILNAAQELARRLARTHTVALAAPRPVGGRVPEFAFVELPAIDLDPALATPVRGRGGVAALRRWLYRLRHGGAGRRAGLAGYRPVAFLEVARTYDLLLIDIELHEYIFAAYGAELRFLLLSQWFSTWRREGLPPLLDDTIPGVGEAGRPERLRRRWDDITRRRRWRAAKQRWLSAGTDRRSLLRALARENGFPERYIPDNFWPGMFTYAELPVLSMTAGELEFPHDRRPNLHYLGPMVYARRPQVVSDELAAFWTTTDPLILVTVSTLHAGDTAFLRRVVAAVENRPWRVVIGLGGKVDAAALGELPANVLALDYVPQLAVLARAALSLNHGGIHTINECITFGTPMLVYHGKRSDQPGCAARVHYHGLGVMADKDTDGVEEIRTKIDYVLSEERFRRRVQEVRDNCRARARERPAEKLVAHRLQQPPRL